ncbi:FtsX-like permease family protein [Halalkalibacterium halodurans]|uniref:FtsX-like permease family protein n=1 Tax=Halalkalibacterium halodurans TaxID=86665 RepID=UPI002E1C0BC5|nr:FtsX-like permease family protein [Halalkalibacterium halodurans]MED4163235.1 bacitracin ABC transporter permease [Halalkalibacterium halodurans]
MTINHLILQNLKKNLKNYYLYVFALMFSVALYFAFVTLQYDPAMDDVQEGIKGAAAMKTASVLLVVIVTTFLLYANNIFIKRRSKEIGLFQMIGMTKGKVFRILSAENLILYFGSLAGGVFIGFAISKVVTMILFKLTGLDRIATLSFSVPALVQTMIVFTLIYGLILLANYLFVKRQTILSLFRVTSSSEDQVRRVSLIEVIIGILGIVSILVGYFVSSILFGGTFTSMETLFIAMIFILGSVIIGTYFFYKGSVTFLFNLIRKKKNGHLAVRDVLSLSSIMFRMKSNALILTIITTISGLAIGLLSLSYISYYSAEKTAEHYVPSDFTLTDMEDAAYFKEALDAHGIAYDETVIDVLIAEVYVKDILEEPLDGVNFDSDIMILPVIRDTAVESVNVAPEEAAFTGYNDMMQQFMSLKDSGSIELRGKQKVIPQNYIGLHSEYLVSTYFSSGGLPLAIVNETTFSQLQDDINPEIQLDSSVHIGIDIKDARQLQEAVVLFHETPFTSETPQYAQVEMSQSQKQTFGLAMFIVGFLGLTFLITSGCILYFKQMGESEEEKGSYTILRKLGFTQGDLLKGIRVKQVFNFGIPLLLGLSHSYFAVKSGWFFFGTELWTPMIMVMLLYTALYSIFAILSVLYYKKVIKDAL